MKSLAHLFRWFEATAIGTAIRDSTYLFPSIEVVHLLGLVLLLGSLVVVDLRLLGFGLRRQPVPYVAKAVRPFTWIGIGVTLTTGTLLFLSEATKCFGNPAFWFKMAFLTAALLFHGTVHRIVTASPGAGSRDVRPGRAGSLGVKLTGLVSLALWFGVGLGGRAIGWV